MPTSRPITIQVSDIVKWFREKALIINPIFQRHSVWTIAAQTYLIDSILNELPVPQIYLRTLVDPEPQTTTREIVDGQQRVRAIVAFADNKLKLSSRSEDFAGCTYDDLDAEDQERFLGYTFTGEQLLNATDDDVIDIFARINSYTVPLNATEKRHAEFQTEFKFAVRKASQEFRWFIEKYRVFSTRQRFRMADDEFMAGLFGIILEGVTDGGAAKLRQLYTRQDDVVFDERRRELVRGQMQGIFGFLDQQLEPVLSGALAKHYHLSMLIAAYAHIVSGIPQGVLEELSPRGELASTATITDRIAQLETALDSEDPPERFRRFVEASRSSTQRIASRRVRFREMLRVLSV